MQVVETTPAEAKPETAALGRSLLEEPAHTQGDTRQPAYPPFDIALISLFVVLHVTILIVAAVPTSGPAARLHAIFGHTVLRAYIHLAGTAGKWGMFAPDVPRANVFMKVLVEDDLGRTIDLRQDIHGRKRYPYLFFDRPAAMNWFVSAKQPYQPIYAAFICREWERRHGGQPARAVVLDSFLSTIPSPHEAIPSGGYDPMQLELRRVDTQRFDCAWLPHAQLPDSLRARWDLPAATPGTFQEIPIQTWWTDAQRRSDLPRVPRRQL